MWHINRKPIKSSIQICQLNAHLTTHLTVSSWKWPENDLKIVFFITVFFQGSMSTPNEIRSYFSTSTLVLTYIFISWINECSFDHSFDLQQLKLTGKWPENRFFYNCFFSGEHVHTNWDRKLNFGMDNGIDLYFHNLKKVLSGRGDSGPPPLSREVTTPKIRKKCLGSCDILIESLWEALFKYVNQMFIWPLFDRPQLKMTGELFFWKLFYWREHVHTEWDRKLNFNMDIGFEFWPISPFLRGDKPLKNWK